MYLAGELKCSASCKMINHAPQISHSNPSTNSISLLSFCLSFPCSCSSAPSLFLFVLKMRTWQYASVLANHGALWPTHPSRPPCLLSACSQTRSLPCLLLANMRIFVNEARGVGCWQGYPSPTDIGWSPSRFAHQVVFVTPFGQLLIQSLVFDSQFLLSPRKHT